MEFDSPRAKIELMSGVLSGFFSYSDVKDILMKCTSCKKCTEACPYGIDIVELLQDFAFLMRKEKKIKDNVLVKNILDYENPFGEKWEKHGKLSKDIVLFPGCTVFFLSLIHI